MKKIPNIVVSSRIKVDDSSFYHQKVCERSFLMFVGMTQLEIGSKHYKKLKLYTYQKKFRELNLRSWFEESSGCDTN